jgi:hypothetical protein
MRIRSPSIARHGRCRRACRRIACRRACVVSSVGEPLPARRTYLRRVSECLIACDVNERLPTRTVTRAAFAAQVPALYAFTCACMSRSLDERLEWLEQSPQQLHALHALPRSLVDVALRYVMPLLATPRVCARALRLLCASVVNVLGERVAQLYLWTTAHVTLQRADATLVCAVIESSTVQAMARLGASVLIDDVVPLTLRHVRDKRVATGDLCAGVRALAHALPVCVAALHVVMPLREQLDRAAALDVDMLMRTMTVFVSAIDTMPTSVQRAVALPPLTALLRHPTVRSLAGEEVRVFVCAFATLTVCA